MSANSISDTDNEQPLLEKALSDSPGYQYPSIAKQRAIVAVILFAYFFSLCADSIIIPFFPSRAQQRGLSETEVGWIFFSFDFSKFVVSPILGSVLRIWPPKSMCIVGDIVVAFSGICFGAVNGVSSRDWFLGLCLVTRFIAGIGSGMVCVSATSILLKATEYEASTLIGLMEVVVGLGYSLGPTFGAALYELAGFQRLFWIFGGIMLTLVPAYIIFLPNIVEDDKKGAANFFDLLFIPGCFIMFLDSVLLKMNSCSFNVGIGPFLTSTFDAKPSIVGYLFALWSVCFALICPLVSKLMNKLKGYSLHIITVSWFGYAAVSLFLGPSPLLNFIFHGERYFWQTITVSIVFFIVAGFQHVPSFQPVLDLAELNGHEKGSLHTYGMVTGLVHCAWGLGAATGPIVGGALIDAVTFEWFETIAAAANACMGIVLIAYLIYMKCTNQPITPEELDAVESEDNDSHLDPMTKKVNDACHKRLCHMRSNNDMTTVHQQQPITE